MTQTVALTTGTCGNKYTFQILAGAVKISFQLKTVKGGFSIAWQQFCEVSERDVPISIFSPLLHKIGLN